jgi:GGDEF domain-containing protein
MRPRARSSQRRYRSTRPRAPRAAARAGRYPIKVVDRRTGSVIVDSRTVQRRGALLGVPSDRRFRALRARRAAAGALSVAGRRVAYTHVPAAAGNANDWLVVAVATSATPSLTASFGAGPIGMVIAAILLLAFALVAARAGHLSSEANRDDLTGLTNRRGLLRRLDRAIRRASREQRPVALLMIDLDHFKELNDTLGHAVGDSLLAKFGSRTRSGARTRWLASAATSSPWCSPTPRPPRTWRGGSPPRSTRRSRSTRFPCTSTRASA